MEGKNMMWSDGGNMKHGCCVTHKNAACYVQIPRNLVELVEKQSDHVKLLTEKVERLEDFKYAQQYNGVKDNEGNASGTTSEEISTEHVIKATVKEHSPTVIKNNRKKEKNNKW